MAFVNPDDYKALTINHSEDSSDGLYRRESDGQLVLVRGSEVVQGLDPALTCRVFEDFIGTTAVPASADTSQSVWLTKDTSAAGAPTLAVSDDYDAGAFELKVAANDEAEVLTLYWGDQQNIDPAYDPIMTCRLKVVATPAATDTIVFGLASAQNDTPDSVASNAWFRIEGANLNPVIEADNGTTDTDDKSTGITLTANTWYEFRVDATNHLAVRYFYRATLGGDWTELTTSDTFKVHATTGLQPFVQVQKSGGVTQVDVLIDYIDVQWRRN